MKLPRTTLFLGICILCVSNSGKCDSNSRKDLQDTSGKTKLLSILTVIDCEFPDDAGWNEDSTHTVQQSSQSKQKSTVSPNAPILDFSDVYSHDKATFEVLNEIFTPQTRPTSSKTQAYLNVASELNLKFINRGYSQIKDYETSVSDKVESQMTDLTDLKIKFDPDITELSITTSIHINDFQKLDITANTEDQGIYYKVSVPVERMREAFANPVSILPVQLPFLPLGATNKLIP